MITEDKKAVLHHFSEGRKSYKIMDFEAAKNSFIKALKVDPEDGPSKVYLARCKHYIDSPPPEDWDGVFVMTTK